MNLSSSQQSKESLLALTLSGGGARAAYQVGVLRAVARQHPQLSFPLLTGVSAGAINISHLAAFEGRLPESTEALTELWMQLRLENVFRVGAPALLWRALKVGMRLSIGVPPFLKPVHGMVDTDPLREYLHHALRTKDGTLPGIARNLDAGRLQGVALTAHSYANSETVTFFSGRAIDSWERAYRRSVETGLTVEHVMASAALPLLFSPVQLQDRWYGDGGIRLSTPLAPAIHMGAEKLMVISTHYSGSPKPPATASEPPSPATVMAALYNAVFLDHLDDDVRHMQRINQLLAHLSVDQRNGLREIGLLVIQPSRDLGSLAFDLRHRLPKTVRFMLDRFGGNQEESDDFLSTMLFHPDYVQRLIETGEQDADAQADQIAEFLEA